MLEIVKSKMMMGVAFLLLGIVFINANATNKLEESSKEVEERVVVMNLR